MPTSEIYKVKAHFAKEQAKVQSKILEVRSHLLDQLHPLVPEPWVHVELHEPLTLFKVIAVAGDKFVSVFNGSTCYTLGKWTFAKQGAASWPPLSSCLYAFATPQQAVDAIFPTCSRLKGFPKVLIEVEARGHAYMNQETDGLWALSKLRFRSVVTQLAQRVPLHSLRTPASKQSRTSTPPVALTPRSASTVTKACVQGRAIDHEDALLPAGQHLVPYETPCSPQPAGTWPHWRASAAGNEHLRQITRHGLGMANEEQKAIPWHAHLRDSSVLDAVDPAVACKPVFRPASGGSGGMGKQLDAWYAPLWSHAPRAPEVVVEGNVAGFGGAGARDDRRPVLSLRMASVTNLSG